MTFFTGYQIDWTYSGRINSTQSRGLTESPLLTDAVVVLGWILLLMSEEIDKHVLSKYEIQKKLGKGVRTVGTSKVS